MKVNLMIGPLYFFMGWIQANEQASCILPADFFEQSYSNKSKFMLLVS